MYSLMIILTFVTTNLAGTDQTTYYSTIDNRQGIFQSPDYPYSYKKSLSESYNFSGQPNEKVQIIFDDFKLHKKDSNQRCGNANSYISYKRGNEKKTVYLCGMTKPLPIISELNKFELNYKQVVTPTNEPGNVIESIRGFNATYRFITNYGIDTGEQTDNICEFTYCSTNELNGTFTSPNYDGFYPNPIECHYYFKNHKQYIKLNFTTFNLQGSDDCNDINGRDYLEVANNVEKDRTMFYRVYCGMKNESFEIMINDTFLYIVLHRIYTTTTESELLQSYPFFGFKATFEFIGDTSPNSNEENLPVPMVLFSCICLIFKLRTSFV